MLRKHFVPHEYQRLITNHILQHERCAIWAGMGLGKTSSTLNAIETLLMVEDDPVLVVAPLRVARTTWPDEARKWEHLRGLSVMPIVGTEAERILALRQPAQVYTVNYENLPWLVERWGDKWPYRTVVPDEATRVKGFRLRQGTHRAKALGKVAHTRIRRIIELTGTPSPNGLIDLWGQMWFIDRGQRLGRTFDAFKQRWFQASHDGYGLIPLPHAQREIQALLADVCLTVDAKDWFDLREPIVNTIHVDLPMTARKHYREMEKAMFTEIEAHQVEAFNAAARTIKCLQIANGAAYVGEAGTADWKPLHDAKLQALDSVIEEASGAPVLVAYHFKSDLARLQQAYPDGLLLSTHEGLRAAQAGQGRVWFGHPASMGHGVDGLQQHCNILAFFGHWWNLEERLQMVERIGPTRQMQAGHDRPVFVHNIIARDTVDELVLARIETKREVQDLLLEAMKTRRTHA